MAGIARIKKAELRNRLWQYTQLSSLARFFWLCHLVFQFLQILLSPRRVYERAAQSRRLLLLQVSGCLGVPGPSFALMSTSMFSNLLPGHMILDATCRKK